MYMRIISDESLKLYVIGYNLLEIDWGLFRCFKALVPGRFQSTSASSTEGRWCLMIFSTFSRGAGDDIARDTTGRVFFSHFGAQKIMEETPHVMLVGTGAQQFALEQGSKLESGVLLPDAEKAYKQWL
jgi:hypothetical protein